MLALDLTICECCGKVGKSCIYVVFGSVETRLCEECRYRFDCDSLSKNDFIKKYETINVFKNKKILEIILADAKNKIKEQFGVEV